MISVPASPTPGTPGTRRVDSSAMLAAAKKDLAQSLEARVRDHFGVDYQATVEVPPRRELGDLALTAGLQLARTLGRNPRSIGQELADGWPLPSWVREVRVAGPGFLNVFLDRSATAAHLLAEPLLDVEPRPSEKVIVEHTNINPNKAAHIGHLRNAVLGDVLSRALRALGHPVEVQNYIDDTGVQLADVVVALMDMQGLTLSEVEALGEPFDYTCWDLYSEVAGWYEAEHDGYGYPFLPPPGRLGMLREGVEIMKAMWTEDLVTYEGEHYQLDGAISQPKPLQDPHLPLWIAGGGEQVTLKIAARHAQYSNFGGDDIEVFEKKSAILEGHCKEVGSDFEAIVRSANFNILCGESDADVDEKKRWFHDHLSKYVSEKAADRWIRMYESSSGTPNQIVSKLKDFEGAGLGYAIVNFADIAYDRGSIELFAREVMPHFS